MNRIIIVMLITILPLLAVGQRMPEMKALNRVIMHRHDTVYQFYTAHAPKKFRINNNSNYHWYRLDSVFSTQGGFAGKLLHGKFITLLSNGRLVEERSYRYGLKTGVWKLWDESGKLISTSVWKNGVEQLSRRERKKRKREA